MLSTELEYSNHICKEHINLFMKLMNELGIYNNVN